MASITRASLFLHCLAALVACKPASPSLPELNGSSPDWGYNTNAQEVAPAAVEATPTHLQVPAYSGAGYSTGFALNGAATEQKPIKAEGGGEWKPVTVEGKQTYQYYNAEGKASSYFGGWAEGGSKTWTMQKGVDSGGKFTLPNSQVYSMTKKDNQWVGGIFSQPVADPLATTNSQYLVSGNKQVIYNPKAKTDDTRWTSFWDTNVFAQNPAAVEDPFFGQGGNQSFRGQVLQANTGVIPNFSNPSAVPGTWAIGSYAPNNRQFTPYQDEMSTNQSFAGLFGVMGAIFSNP